jgi:hypothetical protein
MHPARPGSLLVREHEGANQADGALPGRTILKLKIKVILLNKDFFYFKVCLGFFRALNSSTNVRYKGHIVAYRAWNRSGRARNPARKKRGRIRLFREPNPVRVLRVAAETRTWPSPGRPGFVIKTAGSRPGPLPGPVCILFVHAFFELEKGPALCCGGVQNRLELQAPCVSILPCLKFLKWPC